MAERIKHMFYAFVTISGSLILIFFVDYIGAYLSCYYENIVITVFVVILVGILIFADAKDRIGILFCALFFVFLALISSFFGFQSLSMEMADQAVSCNK